MTKNNLKIVKTDDKKDKELKEKNKSLDAAISQIDQNFGKGSVMRLGQQQALDIEAISTGSLSLDLALGIGGLPKGRIIEIYGPESSGKTTLALQVIAEAQKTLQGTLFRRKKSPSARPFIMVASIPIRSPTTLSMPASESLAPRKRLPPPRTTATPIP